MPLEHVTEKGHYVVVSYNNNTPFLSGRITHKDNFGIDIDHKGKKFFIPWAAIKNIQLQVQEDT